MSRQFSTPKKDGSADSSERILAKKSLGQNFLEDKNIINKIVASAGLNKTDTVLEIGPGLGALTLPLAYHSKKVVAVEKDGRLAQKLKKSIQPLKLKNIEIIQADILKELAQGKSSQIFKKLGQHYRVVANIPYYITAPLIRNLLEASPQPEEITLMVQKEVAQRISEVPPNMNLLAVAVQYYASPKILFYVSKNCFWPKPQVDSAVINLTPYRESNSKTKNLFKVVKAGFSCPRKQILNNLSAGLQIEKQNLKIRLIESGFNPAQRAESFTIGDWEKLSDII